MAKNKKWSAAAKFEIAVQALKGETTLNEICTRYEVSPSQVHAWKKHLLEQGKDLFNKKADKTAAKAASEHEHKQTKLYETIGQLTVERDFLKKSWEKIHGKDDES
jgi:transposase